MVYLKTRYQVAVTLLTQLELGLGDKALENDFIEELRKWKYKINKDRPLKDELGRMLKQLKASTNAITIKPDQRIYEIDQDVCTGCMECVTHFGSTGCLVAKSTSVFGKYAPAGSPNSNGNGFIPLDSI